MLTIKANFVSSKSITSNGKILNLCCCINEELGSFNFFTPTALKLDYLKPVQLDFQISSMNSKLFLKFNGIK